MMLVAHSLVFPDLRTIFLRSAKREMYTFLGVSGLSLLEGVKSSLLLFRQEKRRRPK